MKIKCVDECLFACIGDDGADECIGGVIRNGQFSWTAIGATIEIFSMKSGSKVANYTFDNQHPQRYVLHMAKVQGLLVDAHGVFFCAFFQVHQHIDYMCDGSECSRHQYMRAGNWRAMRAHWRHGVHILGGRFPYHSSH